MAEEIGNLLKNVSGRSSPLRRETALPLPVDNNSRLHLVRLEQPTAEMPEPVYAPEVAGDIQTIIRERQQAGRLADAGLEPTRSALFVGPPGVGKTMSARWIASQLNLPLLILDLSAVMSSFFGRTGNNVRAVLDFAKRQNCVLLLDELDTIAKRRDNVTEIGELKRLVTVLLQEIDEWPADGLLLAATNHPELLDPAVWRRFDSVVSFPSPQRSEIERAISEYLGDETTVGREWIDIMSIIFGSMNFSDIKKRMMALRRNSMLNNRDVSEVVKSDIHRLVKSLPHADQISLASKLYSIKGISQRRAAEITGVSRDTLRKRGNKQNETNARGSTHG